MPIEVLQVLGWGPLVLILCIALVCFLHLRLSKRMWLLLAGFLGLALTDIGFKAVDALFRAGQMALPDVGPAHAVLFFVRTICWGMILGGLICVFADLRERVDTPPRDSTDPRPPWQRD